MKITSRPAHKWFALLFFATALFFTNCTSENSTPPPVDLEAQLTGRWELQKAVRNGKQTATLSDLVFEFLPDNKMRTNFNASGAMENGVFQINKGLIEQRETKMEVDYSVISITDSVMVLQTDLRSVPFQLYLQKMPLEQ